jgi:hypothetical protein
VNLAEAKAAAAVSKTAVKAALAKSLKLDDPDTLHFWSDTERLTVERRAEKKPRAAAASRHLTA